MLNLSIRRDYNRYGNLYFSLKYYLQQGSLQGEEPPDPSPTRRIQKRNFKRLQINNTVDLQ